MPDKNLSFANIVATPTPSSWSQTYNAGKLFAVLSLEMETIIGEGEKEPLNSVGKEFYNHLEQEYFSLENKDLDSIRNAILVIAHKIPAEIDCSFVAASFEKNILYVFVLGKGKASLKRKESFGTILSSVEGSTDSIKASSGHLENNDLIILQTSQFIQIISTEDLSASLDHLTPSEIAETLAPTIHGSSEGGAAAVIVAYKEVFEPKLAIEEETIEDVILEPQIEEETAFSEPSVIQRQKHNSLLKKIKQKISLGFLQKPRLNHSKKLYLTIAVILMAVFVLSIILSIQKQQNAKTQALFNDIYPRAEKKYEEGQSLSDLNKNLARDSFLVAQKILNDGKDKFTKNSKEEKQIKDLLNKVDQAVGESANISTVAAKEVGSDTSNLLSFEAKTSGNAFTTDGKNNFYINSKSVFKEDKEIIKNNSDWKNPAGIGTYYNNVYVLDKVKGGILKFVPSGSEYSKANYFAENVSPDLTKATGMAIDGSIWVLLNDGNILKFTKGSADNFKVSGLDKPLANPTKIYTNVDIDNVYILDNGNSRIVVLKKDGTYKEQYQATVIKNAKDFEVNEAAKKILLLSSGKIYEISLR